MSQYQTFTPSDAVAYAKRFVTPEVAAEDACRIEHDISPETFACLKRHAGGGES